MATPMLSPAKAVLLAVQLASKCDISALRTLISKHRKALRIELILRILLSHLPESLESSEYVPFIQDLVDGNIEEETDSVVDSSSLKKLGEKDAAKQVKRLHLLPLAWSYAPADAPQEPIVLFLIHRSLRIDENTGLITQIPDLVAPFLHHSHYLRTWMISTILPLLRLYYVYHPGEIAIISIPAFQRLDDEAGIALLLSGTRKQVGVEENTVGRDLKGLVGPWMYGDTRQKRRKLRRGSSAQTIIPLDEAPVSAVNEKCASWEEVFKWITAQAVISWKTAVQAIEQWDGPGDIDLGGYEDGTEWLDEDDQQYLERRYARSALAAAYSISDETPEALIGVHQILSRIIVLLNLDGIPTLEASGALLVPVDGLDMFSAKDAGFLRNGLLDEQNTLTQPNKPSLKLLHTALTSAYLVTKQSFYMSVRRAAELALRQDQHDQSREFVRFMSHCDIKLAQKADDKYCARMRNVVLWLRNWGSEDLTEGSVAGFGRGIFGKISKQTIEVAILKALLSHNRLLLAQTIYERSSDSPLSKQVIHGTVIAAAMDAYDNATNANKTRGGVKRCKDILRAFPDTLKGSLNADQLEHLIHLTHSIGNYRLVFKQGEPFTPVILRVHGDPISILGKVLEQNSGSYTKINDFIDMGKNIVKAGLTTRDTSGKLDITNKPELQEAIAEKRVVCMCIDAALNEDDFETAYSYIMSRLELLATSAHTPTTDFNVNAKGLVAEPPPTVLDDWSWKAALQAGKYRRNQHTVKPTHLGNASGNAQIRHLQQRMDCLSLALRCSPSSALQEILNAFRRCEEELQVQVRQEEEEEAAWDEQGDQAIPGGFTSPKGSNDTKYSLQATEEAPMSLFDLSRASFSRAQTGLSALSVGQGEKGGESRFGSSRSGTPAQRARKRDQLAKAAAGTLASGVGWLIGAPSSASASGDSS